MKLIWLLFISLLFVSCGTVKPERVFKGYDKSNPLNLENSALYSYPTSDDFKKVAFLYFSERELKGSHRYWRRSVKFNPYIGINYSKAKKPYLKLIISYKGDSWIFFKDIHFLCDKGKEFKISGIPHFKKKNEASGGMVFEEYHANISRAKLGVIAKRCSNARIRVSGKEIKEFEMIPEEHIRFKEALYYYDQIKKYGYKAIYKSIKKAQKNAKSKKGTKKN